MCFQSAASSGLNTTFDVEESDTSSEKKVSSTEKLPTEKVVTAKPPKMTRQKSARTVLSQIQSVDDIRSSDEFEKPRLMKKSVSAGILKGKSNADGEDDMFSVLSDMNKKKRKLTNPKKNFFQPPQPDV